MSDPNARLGDDHPALAEGRRQGTRPHVDKADELVRKIGDVSRDGEVSALKEKRRR
jgi:hypothetical protein